MKALLKIIFLCGIIVFTAFSCETNEENLKSQTIDCMSNEDTVSIEISPLGELGFGADTLACHNDCGNAIDYKGKQFIIQSDNDYNELLVYAECLLISNWPQIDFDQSTVLAGVSITNTICKSITGQSVKKVCKDNNLIYSVNISGGGYTALGAVYYWVLIPKISADQEVEFQILIE